MNKNTMYIVGALGLGALAYFYFRKPKDQASTQDSGQEKSVDSPQGQAKSMSQNTDTTLDAKGYVKNKITSLQKQAEEMFPMPENASAQEATRVSDKRRAWIRQNLKGVTSRKKGSQGEVSRGPLGSQSSDSTVGELDAKFAFNGLVF